MHSIYSNNSPIFDQFILVSVVPIYIVSIVNLLLLSDIHLLFPFCDFRLRALHLYIMGGIDNMFLLLAIYLDYYEIIKN